MNNRTPGPPPGWEPTARDTGHARHILDDRAGGPLDTFLAGALLATLHIVAEDNSPGSLTPRSARAIRLAFALDDAARPGDLR